MTYSKILDIKSCLVSGGSSLDLDTLEPGKLLEQIPKEYAFSQDRLVVALSDGNQKIEMQLSIFLSRTYRVSGDFLRIGMTRLRLDNLVVFIGFKVILENLASMTEKELD
jgi:hypothetical protein